MRRLILEDANLLDGDQPGRPASVVVEGDRIASICDGGVQPRPGDRVIAMDGRTVMPGMVQAHFHAAYWQVGTSGRPLGLEVSPAHTTLRAAANLTTAFQCGYTGVIGAGGPHGIDAAMKAAIAEGSLVGPRIMAGSRDISSTGHSGDMSYPSWLQIGGHGGVRAVDGPEAIRHAVREEAKNGAEIVKLFVTRGHGTGGTGAEWELAPEEIAMAVRTAAERGIKARAHVSNRDAVLLCLDLGVHIIDHGDGFDEQCVERILEKGAFLTPSLLFPRRMMQVAAGTSYAETLKAEFDQTAAYLPQINKAGVPLLIGDDYGAAGLDHGSYAEELALYVNEIGIPALDVIRWATKHGAQAMGLGDETGTVAPGKLADLLIVDGDPSADITVLGDRTKLLAILKGGDPIKDELQALERLDPEDLT